MKKLKLFKTKYLRNEIGMALLWSLVTITVLLAITGSMAGLIIKESRMSSGIDLSIRAYAAAESGLEHGTFLATQDTPGTSPCKDKDNKCSIGSSEYFFIIDYSVTDKTTITSTGKSGTTNRRIEKTIERGSSKQPAFFNYNKSNPNLLDSGLSRKFQQLSDFSGFSSIDTSMDSFVQRYNITTSDSWGVGAGGDSVSVGLSEGQTEDKDRMINVIFSGNATHSMYNPMPDCSIPNSFTGVTIQIGDQCENKDLPSFVKEEDYTVELYYQKGVGARVKINKGVNGDGGCIGILTLSNPDFNVILDMIAFRAKDNMNYSDEEVTRGPSSINPPNNVIRLGNVEAEIPFMGLLLK